MQAKEEYNIYQPIPAPHIVDTQKKFREDNELCENYSQWIATQYLMEERDMVAYQIYMDCMYQQGYENYRRTE